MSGIQFRDGRGQSWRVNQDGLWLLCQQFIFAQMMYERAHVVPEKTSFFSIGPNISNVQIDFSGFQARKTMQAQSLCDGMARASLENGQSVFDQLVQMKDELDLNTCNLAAMKRRVSQDNASSIESHVGFFGMGAKVATVIRDGAAAVLLVTSAIATVGATAAAVGGTGTVATAAAGGGWFTMTAGGGMGVTALGSAMKGMATYEDSVLVKGHNWSDSGSIGAGVVQATSTFFVNAIPLLPKFGVVRASDAISKPVLMLITAPVNAFSTFAVGVTKGDSMGKSLINTVVSTGLSALPLSEAIGKLAVPIAVKYSMPTLQKAVSAGVQSVVEVALDRAQNAAVDRLTKPHKPHVSQQLAKLIGVPGTPGRPRTNKEYVCDEVMCPA